MTFLIPRFYSEKYCLSLNGRYQPCRRKRFVRTKVFPRRPSHYYPLNSPYNSTTRTSRWWWNHIRDHGIPRPTGSLRCLNGVSDSRQTPPLTGLRAILPRWKQRQNPSLNGKRTESFQRTTFALYRGKQTTCTVGRESTKSPISPLPYSDIWEKSQFMSRIYQGWTWKISKDWRWCCFLAQ